MRNQECAIQITLNREINRIHNNHKNEPAHWTNTLQSQQNIPLSEAHLQMYWFSKKVLTLLSLSVRKCIVVCETILKCLFRAL